MPRRAVFLDKDGTLIENVPYNVDPVRIRLAPRAVEGLRMLAGAGFALVVVSNQSGVARGYFDLAALELVRERLEMLLAAGGVRLDGFHFCPHHPDGSVEVFARPCDCRKPLPGMLRHAARDLGIDLEQSWMVGDILDDVEAGRAAGCRSVLVDNGNETEWRSGSLREPHVRVADLHEAARVITGATPSAHASPAGAPPHRVVR
jgi:D-glycero-D-manno-heptose 1,7-bisphosphate phosphatase